MQYMVNCLRPLAEKIKIRYKTGGTNVTQRGINFASSVTDGRIVACENHMTSGSLAGSILISDSGTETNKTRNHYDLTKPLNGIVTMGSGTGSVIVTNGNVANGSRIFISPANAGAALQQSDDTNGGIYASEENASGRFRLITGDGTATSTSGDWYWEIDG
jgi:hypothetical protein